jgi:glycosyltransferase involved in cell wall biosynthesis
MKRLRLVLSLYACEPNRGSEPGIGWAWALGMAKRHETYVLTRANNREVIEAELARLNLSVSEAPNFIYVDLSPFVCLLKKCRIIPVSIYYLIWQFKARSTLDTLNINADIIHHATFCSFMVPGVWWNRKEKVVLGPLGGMSVCRRAFLRLFPYGRRVREFLRGISRRHLWRLNPFFLISRRNADALLFTEESIREELSGYQACSSVLLDVAVPQVLEERQYDLPLIRKKQFVWAGILEPRKGLKIALKAYAKAFVTLYERPIFKVFGAGSGLEEAQKLAHELGITDDVEFLGKVSQSQLWEEMRQSMAFVFTSVRDTCGSVNLEAMACQCPIICFNHQGVGMATDDTCAIRVEPSDWDSAVQDFADAMRLFVGNPEHTARMGQAGRERVFANFTWDMKFELASEIYKKVTNDNHSDTAQ